MVNVRLRSSSGLAVVAALLALGCGDGGAADALEAPPPSPTHAPSPEPEEVGSLSLALETAHGSFDSFRYVITGPSFSRSGLIDVSKSGRVSAVIEGIPVGAGYTVTLSGTSASGEPLVCSGSATFAVRAGEVTSAPVAISCHVGEAPEEPPAEAMPAPLPPLSSAALAAVLLAVGALSRRPSS